MRSVADDCLTSPVGYLEGWWVEEEYRRRGIGRALVDACIGWAIDRYAVEFASDAHEDNEVSRIAHARLGFEENPRPVVKFRKPIGEGKPVAPQAAGEVTLRPVDAFNIRAVCDLRVAPHQHAFVAPNAQSVAEASVAEDVWVRAIYADAEPAGFVMLSDDAAQPRYYVWRFMIDERHQGLGIGARAMDLVHDYVRTRPGGDRIYVSYVPAPGGPQGFYQRLGYTDTGRVHRGEVEAMKEL